jgi:mRNA interferase RelE/StbE
VKFRGGGEDGNLLGARLHGRGERGPFSPTFFATATDMEALDRLIGDPAAGDVVKLAGVDDEWRLRVGDWRVRFTRDDEQIVHVLRVLPRGRAYRD